MQKLALICLFILLLSVFCLLTASPYDTNLVTNPGAESGVTGWDFHNYGSSWSDAGYVHSGSKGFITSYYDQDTFDCCTKTQTINLIAAGFSATELDAGIPIEYSEWIRAGGAAGGSRYCLKVDLLDGTNNILATWNRGTFGASTLISIPWDTDWFMESHTFVGYPTGVRSVRLFAAGTESSYWGGHFGACFDDACLMLPSTPNNTTPGGDDTIASAVPVPISTNYATLSGNIDVTDTTDWFAYRVYPGNHINFSVILGSVNVELYKADQTTPINAGGFTTTYNYLVDETGVAMVWNYAKITSAGRAIGDYAVYVTNADDNTLPVTLTAFNAVPTSDGDTVNLSWTTASENSVLGYHIFRGATNNFDTAEQLTITPKPAANVATTNVYTYSDNVSELPNGQYYYYLQLVNLDGTVENLATAAAIVNHDGNNQDIPVPTAPANALLGNYPNPFNPNTTIKYSLIEASHADINIYDIRGHLVRNLSQDARDGVNYLTWNGTDRNGKNLSSGVYFYKIKAGAFKANGRMMLIK